MAATRYFHTRCNWAGTSCPDHGYTVRASSPREALEMVVDGQLFGPLHRATRDADRFVALVKPTGILSGDTRHGAIEVIPGRPSR